MTTRAATVRVWYGNSGIPPPPALGALVVEATALVWVVEKEKVGTLDELDVVELTVVVVGVVTVLATELVVVGVVVVVVAGVVTVVVELDVVEVELVELDVVVATKSPGVMT